MNKKQIDKLILILVILALISLNYSTIDSFLEKTFSTKQEVFVIRAIDGDTVESDIGSIRLLGINSPERGEKYYDEAKDFLKNKIENKTVQIEFGRDRYDRYNRTLGYIFYNNENINQKIVEEGLANVYFPEGKQKYYSNFQISWEKCIDKNINLCEISNDECGMCIELKDLNVKSQEIVLYNNCNFSCNLDSWSIKDEGRKNFYFNNFKLEAGKEVKIIVGNGTEDYSKLYWKGEEYVWTSTGDTLFLRDKDNKLVLWKRY